MRESEDKKYWALLEENRMRERHIEQTARKLLNLAQEYGFVVTITNEPILPPTGAHKPKVDIRLSRAHYTKIAQLEKDLGYDKG